MTDLSRGRQAFSPVSDEMTSAWIDISVPIYSGMVCWPGDPAVRIDRVHDLSRGDAANVPGWN
jgi:kynurenine formamidase